MTTSLDFLLLPTGTLLFSEGDVGDHAYLIRSGEIEIVVERDGRELVLARRSANEIIGEMALLDHGTRSASARVVKAAEVVAFTKRQLDQRIADTDPILRMCLGVVIERYRDTLKVIRPDASPAPPPSRIVNEDTFDAAVAMLTLEREIEVALERAEFELFLQPIVAMADRTLAGFEALVRWNHPVRGLLPPNQFIPVAESSGLVVRITDWMLHEAARALPLLLAARHREDATGADPLFVSINVSAHDLLRPSFAEGIMAILREAAIPPHHFKLEITESMLMKDPTGAGRILEACRNYGMGIAVDDFGTGYSSLSHLSTLPITTLKIDRCFVQAMVENSTSRKIVNTIRLLAGELGIPVVAEGIESEAEADSLDAIGCEYGQGYLFGRPMPLGDAVLFLKTPPRHRTAPRLLEMA